MISDSSLDNEFISETSNEESLDESVLKVFSLDHILVKIFKNLDADSIKNGSLVCRKWNELIVSSPSVLESVKLVLSTEYEEFCSVRSYRNVCYSYCDCGLGCPKQNFSFRISHIRCFTIKIRHELSSWFKLYNLLSNMPQLESLDINFDGVHMCEKLHNKLSLPQLRSLTISADRIDFLDLFLCKRIEQFNVKRCAYTAANREAFSKFLQQSDSLKNLTLNYKDFDLFKFLDKFPFNLSTLNLNAIRLTKSEEEEINFKKFLVSQRYSLTNLQIVSSNFPESVYKTIFTRLNLQKFTFHTFHHRLPQSKVFYADIEPIQSLKELNFGKGFEPRLQAKCSLLEILTVGEVSEDDLKFIAKFQPKLRHLTCFFYGSTKGSIGPAIGKLNCLKTLTVNYEENLYEIVKICPYLENIQILGEIDFCEREEFASILDKVMKNTQVQHVRLEAYLDTVKEALKMLSCDYDPNRTLTLTIKIHIETDSCLSTTKHIKDILRFPNFQSNKINEIQ